MKRSETCRCGGSISIELEAGEDLDVAAAVAGWRALHTGCERSPQYVDRSGSTSAAVVFGFANPRAARHRGAGRHADRRPRCPGCLTSCVTVRRSGLECLQTPERLVYRPGRSLVTPLALAPGSLTRAIRDRSAGGGGSGYSAVTPPARPGRGGAALRYLVVTRRTLTTGRALPRCGIAHW